MAYDRLQGLGEERFRYLVNQLVRGTPAMQLARTVQQEWKEFTDVAERTLTQQLNRLRLSAAEGMFGAAAAAELATGAKPVIKLLDGVTSGVLDRMEELAVMQRARCLNFQKKENLVPIVKPQDLAATNGVYSEYRETLIAIQKMRFDLGADAFKGPMNGLRGVAQSVTMPDGTNVQRQVFEAFNALEDVF